MSGGLSYAVLRAALHRRSTLPPPQHKAYTASFNSSPPSPLYPSFALLRTRIYYGRWRRFCLPSAKYSPSLHGRGFFISSLRLRLRFGSFLRGEGIGSLHLRLQSFTLRCAPIHFFRLRFRSPMPGERRNGAGTYRNPSPLPPPAIISGRGRRSHALGLLPIVAIQPLLAASRSLCLPQFCNNDSGWNVATNDDCNTPAASTAPAHSAPVRITPRSCQSFVAAGEAATAYIRPPLHFGRGSAMPVVCADACHRSSIHRRPSVAAGLPLAIHRQHHRRPTR